MDFMHGVGLLFPVFSPDFRPNHSGHRIPGSLIEPGRERRMPNQTGRLSRQVGEDHLRYVLGPVRVPGQLAQGRGIHQSEVAIHQLGKGRVGTRLGIAAE